MAGGGLGVVVDAVGEVPVEVDGATIDGPDDDKLGDATVGISGTMDGAASVGAGTDVVSFPVDSPGAVEGAVTRTVGWDPLVADGDVVAGRHFGSGMVSSTILHTDRNQA